MADIDEPDGGADVPPRLWGTDDVSKFLGIPKGTIYKWRSKRKGPPGARVGKYIRWRKEDVYEWFEEHRDEF